MTSHKLLYRSYYTVIISLLLIASNYPQERDPLFSEVEVYLNSMKSESGDILCPEFYDKAVQSYSQAKELNANNYNRAQIRSALESAVLNITQANEVIEKRKEFFESIITLRKPALENNADKFAKHHFSTADNLFSEALDDFINGNEKEAAENFPEIQKNYETAIANAGKAKNLLLEWEPFNKANKNLAKLLSPSSYQNGLSNLESAVENISNGKTDEEVESYKAESEKYFYTASDNSEKFISIYPDLIHFRSEAQKSSAEIYAIEEWLHAENETINAGSSLENNDTENTAVYVVKAMDYYLEAKKAAYKNRILKEPREKVSLAQEFEAFNYSPVTYGRSTGLLEKAEKYIDEEFADTTEINRVAKNSAQSAHNAYQITRIIKSVEAGEQTWEDVILDWNLLSLINKEYMLVPIETKIAARPTEITPEITARVLDEAKLTYDELFNFFTSSEAKIIEEGNDLIISMIGLEFGPMSAVLNESDKSILQKAIQALHQFPNSTYVLTGHTNNVGLKLRNKILSEKRAENTLAYIVQSSNLRASRFSIIGEGEERPIASNLTYEGRSQNERIDLLIRNAR